MLCCSHMSQPQSAWFCHWLPHSAVSNYYCLDVRPRRLKPKWKGEGVECFKLTQNILKRVPDLSKQEIIVNTVVPRESSHDHKAQFWRNRMHLPWKQPRAQCLRRDDSLESLEWWFHCCLCSLGKKKPPKNGPNAPIFLKFAFSLLFMRVIHFFLSTDVVRC